MTARFVRRLLMVALLAAGFAVAPLGTPAAPALQYPTVCGGDKGQTAWHYASESRYGNSATGQRAWTITYTVWWCTAWQNTIAATDWPYAMPHGAPIETATVTIGTAGGIAGISSQGFDYNSAYYWTGPVPQGSRWWGWTRSFSVKFHQCLNVFGQHVCGGDFHVTVEDWVLGNGWFCESGSGVHNAAGATRICVQD